MATTTADLPQAPLGQTVPGRRARRRRKWLLFLLSLGMLAGAYCCWDFAADRRLREVVAELDRLDPGWRWDDLQAARAPVRAAENSAPHVVAAAQLLPRNWPNLRIGASNQGYPNQWDTSPPHRFDESQERVLRTELARAEPALARARALADLPRGRHTIAWRPDVLSTPLTEFHQVRTVSQLLSYQAMLLVEQGDVDGALLDCRAALNAGRSIGDEPGTWPQLVRSVACRSAILSIERALAQGEPASAALADLQRLLQDEAAHPAPRMALRGDRAGFHRAFSAAQAGETGMFSPRQPPAAPLINYLARPRVKELHVASLELLTELVRIAELSVLAQNQQHSELLTTLPFSWHIIFRAFMTNPRLVASFQQGDAEFRCTAVALAIERFRQDQGRWPDRLAELQPDYIEKLPLDPFTEQPLRYRRLADGVVIYSIGPDGTDDGGKFDRKKPAVTGTDLGFRLWDVAQRRQLPLPPSVGPPGR